MNCKEKGLCQLQQQERDLHLQLELQVNRGIQNYINLEGLETKDWIERNLILNMKITVINVLLHLISDSMISMKGNFRSNFNSNKCLNLIKKNKNFNYQLQKNNNNNKCTNNRNKLFNSNNNNRSNNNYKHLLLRIFCVKILLKRLFKELNGLG